MVSPFSPPFAVDEIVSIGEGGHLTLQLARYAIPNDAGPEIGVFTNSGLTIVDFPPGRVSDVLVPQDSETTFGMDEAVVEVSQDGVSFVLLNDGQPVLFDIPSNGYMDSQGPFDRIPGQVLADPSLPFVGDLNDFQGLNYPDIQVLLAGSAGGTWLDISGLGLERVGYIRFSVLSDANELSRLNFELDAVSVALDAQGHVVPLPTSVCLLVGTGALMIIRKY